MSRRDNYRELVKTALIREGWVITHDPYAFQTDPPLSTDIGAERTIAAERGSEKIAVEIKSFLGVSQISELQKALGQYFLYDRLLQRQDPERKLYLAVPTHAYTDIFATEVGRIVLEETEIRLIVFSRLESEELQWAKS
jgi:hypothetical protein